MAFPNDVHLTNGVPDTGTGNVNTINALMAQLAAGPTPVNGTVTANQGGAPWAVNGTITANQGGAPWSVTVSSGTLVISSGTVTIGAALPTGTNSIGTVQPGNTPNTVPWLVKISDGANTPTIKSTAPVGGDVGMVVQLHPNSLNTNGAKATTASAPVTLPTDAATVSVAYDTTQLMQGVSGAGLIPTKARINATTAGVITMVPLVAGKKIRVLAMYLNSTVANTINLQSHVTTTINDGIPAYAATGGMVLPFNPIGWFDTAVGEALDINIGSTGQVSGHFSWIAVN